jgi:hypothetical protein
MSLTPARRCIPVVCALVPVLLGCTARPLSSLPPAPELESGDVFALETQAKIDLLFVVDDSLSMEQEQASLALNFPRFMQALQQGGTTPDLHIAVITTDMGAGGIDQDKCQQTGDAGRFQIQAGCPVQDGPKFLRIDPAGNKNFEGPLTDAFACVAKVGAGGCGYEHQLQSLRYALSDNNPGYREFLRPDAHLGIVIISDEDDCSADFDATLFNDGRPGQNPNLRCATAGHACGGTRVPETAMTAPLASCSPQVQPTTDPERKSALINIDTFVQHVKAQKAPGRRTIVAGIFGYSDAPGTSYAIGNAGGGLDLLPICETAAGKATPAIRLKAFVDAFGEDGSWHSICGGDLSGAMAAIGTTVQKVIDDTCLAARPADLDPKTPTLEVECVISEQPVGSTANPTVIPACGGGAMPCWQIVDEPSCAKSGLRLVTNRTSPAPEGTRQLVRCRTAK